MRFKLFVCLFTMLVVVAKAQQMPNVIFILADDLGYGDLGCYGQTKIATPHIDKLAADGMRFTQFYAGTSVCAPSRASLMTGYHTGKTAIRGNHEIGEEGQFPLPDSAYTMPEMFKDAGYITGVFGKWGLGYPGSEGDPTRQGADQFYGYNCQRQSHNFFPGHLWSNTKRIALKNTPHNQTEYAPQLIQKQAIRFIETNKANPFFVYLAYTLPHAALQLPADDQAFEYYKRKFKEDSRNIPTSWNGKGYQPQAYPRAAYAAMVTKLDNYVGEIVNKLKALGLEKNTLIVFTSDNGPHAEGGNEPEFFNSSGQFRGIKRSLSEGGIRVSTIATWPGTIRPGQTSNHIGAFWDFLPTFAELAGINLQNRTDGISILPTLLNKPKQTKHKFLYWEFHEDGGRQAVRIGNWKGIREQVLQNPNGPIELYDLSKDPGEKDDLAKTNPKIVKRIEKVMLEQHTENEHFPFLKRNR
ncbi:arylsulfatase [Parapedobacter deserti]|uniref:Arylsulfatase n=1 Tax=Parapedobacter deserti TaxID=1912957 RepID=A0ABV7JNP8_9SPHI